MRVRVLGLAAGVVACSCTAHAKELTMSIVGPAIQIQTSLAGDSMAGVHSNAEIIEDAAMKSLAPPSTEIAAAAKSLKATANLADARAAFGKLSEALVAYVDVQKLDLPSREPRIHIAYCPMANKPWLQAGEKIANPYYGSEMPTCGSLKK